MLSPDTGSLIFYLDLHRRDRGLCSTKCPVAAESAAARAARAQPRLNLRLKPRG